jgi:hypothetical protein
MNNTLLLRRDGESLTEWTLRFLREAKKGGGSSRYAFTSLALWEREPVRFSQEAGRK